LKVSAILTLINLITLRRGDHNRLGFAVQLCAARYLGPFPEDLTETPAAALMVLSRPLEVESLNCFADYCTSRQRTVPKQRSLCIVPVRTTRASTSFSRWGRRAWCGDAHCGRGEADQRGVLTTARPAQSALRRLTPR